MEHKLIKSFTECQKPIEKWAFDLFLKSVMSETVTVRNSVRREFHAAGPENEKARSPNLVRSRGVT